MHRRHPVSRTTAPKNVPPDAPTLKAVSVRAKDDGVFFWTVAAVLITVRLGGAAYYNMITDVSMEMKPAALYLAPTPTPTPPTTTTAVR
jgi:hypothetical protein